MVLVSLRHGTTAAGSREGIGQRGYIGCFGAVMDGGEWIFGVLVPTVSCDSEFRVNRRNWARNSGTAFRASANYRRQSCRHLLLAWNSTPLDGEA